MSHLKIEQINYDLQSLLGQIPGVLFGTLYCCFFSVLVAMIGRTRRAGELLRLPAKIKIISWLNNTILLVFLL